MKPAPFAYHAPNTIDEALAILGSDPDGSRLLAGGQSLVPMLNLRLANFDHLIDINRISGLNHVRIDGDRLAIGALARQYDVARNDVVQKRLPVLSRALANVGHTAISNRGTIVGSLCHADPAAELPAVLLAVGGELSVQGTSGMRNIHADDFFDTSFTTALDADEIAVEVRFELATGTTGWSVEEIARRHGDFALVGVVIQMTLEGALIGDVRIALFGVAPIPQRMSTAEKQLIGKTLDDTVLDQAVANVTASLNPPQDIHATAGYRRHVAGVLVRRGLLRASEDAKLRT